MTEVSMYTGAPVNSVAYAERLARLEEAAQLMGETRSLSDIDADTFEKLKGMIDKVEVDPNSKVKAPLKSFVTTALLIGAGIFTARATGGNIMRMLNKNEKLMDNVAKKIMKTAESITKKINSHPALKSKTVKGKVLKASQELMKRFNSFSKKGIEEALKAATGKGSKATKAVLQGKNVIDKVTKTIFGVTGGVTALSGATKDKDKNGIADISEKGEKDPKVAAKVAAAALEMV